MHYTISDEDLLYRIVAPDYTYLPISTEVQLIWPLKF
jgi:hypothetical protein